MLNPSQFILRTLPLQFQEGTVLGYLPSNRVISVVVLTSCFSICSRVTSLTSVPGCLTCRHLQYVQEIFSTYGLKPPVLIGGAVEVRPTNLPLWR